MANDTKKDFVTRVAKDFEPWREAAASHPACSDCNCPAPDSDAILEALTGIFAGTFEITANLQEPCEHIVYVDWTTREGDLPCGIPSERLCASCGSSVCIRHTSPCYQCAADLHDDCREDHGIETGHAIDLPHSS